MTDPQHTPAHDPLQKKQPLQEHEVKEVLAFLKRYGRMIGSGLVAATVVALAIMGISQLKTSRQGKAGQLLMAAATPEQLEEIVSKYSSTPSAPVALIDMARTLFNRGETAKAREQYLRFQKKYRKHELAPVAELGLAYCTEADGDFNGAASQFAAFSEKQRDSYLYPTAILGVARCMEQAKRLDEARIVLEDFLTENAGTLWAGPAEMALKSVNEAAAGQ